MPISGRLMSRIRATTAQAAPVDTTSPQLHMPDAPDRPSRSVGVPGAPVSPEVAAALASPSGSGPRPRIGHYASGSHYNGDGQGQEAAPELTSTDTPDGGHGGPQPANGSGGAAYGGVRPSGSSQPWANPGGIRMGRLYNPVSTLRAIATALHLNRPTLRPIRYTPPVRETGSPYPGGLSGSGTPATSPYDPARPAVGMGPRAPRPLPVQRTGHGVTADQLPGDWRDPGPIGGSWAL